MTQDPIRTISDYLKPHDAIRALFLSGSHGNGQADAYSDLDFVMVAADGANDTTAQLWKDAVLRLGDIVLLRDRQVAPTLINAVNADWLRVDVIILAPDQIQSHKQDALKVVFDRDAIFDSLPAKTTPPAPNPKRIRYQIEEFMRILGLLPVALGRKEYLNGITGMFHLRNILVEIMIAETNALFKGGALHLNRLIDEGQKAALADLSLPEPNQRALIEAHVAIAADFMPRAKRLADALDITWPAALEFALWARLGDTLGIAKPN